MTPATHDLVVRIAEAMRAAAVTAARGPAHDLARGGYDKEARAHNSAAHDVGRIDIEAIVAIVAELAMPSHEIDAFYAAARANGFNTSHRDDGSFIYPQTENVFAVWRAAVRRGELNPIDRSPAPQHKAGTGVAAD